MILLSNFQTFGELLKTSYQKETIQTIFQSVTAVVATQIQREHGKRKGKLFMQVPHIQSTLRYPLYLTDNPINPSEEQIMQQEQKIHDLEKKLSEALKLVEKYERVRFIYITSFSYSITK